MMMNSSIPKGHPRDGSMIKEELAKKTSGPAVPADISWDRESSQMYLLNNYHGSGAKILIFMCDSPEPKRTSSETGKIKKEKKKGFRSSYTGCRR
jgi:hypothetical protein